MQSEAEFVNQIHTLLSSTPPHSQRRILNSLLYLVKPSTDSTTHTLTQIAATLKQHITPSSLALSPDENISVPQTHAFIDYTLDNTVNIDAFLYGVDEVEEMVDQGELPSHLCNTCGSRDVGLLNYISHSASIVQCKWMFESLKSITPINASTRILDIGSRLGPILYTVSKQTLLTVINLQAWLMTDSKHIHGIELNSYFTELQSKICNKYKMADRVTVHTDDILSDVGLSLIELSDIVVMNNVFQFFGGRKGKANADVKAIWSAIRSVMRYGTVLVCVPSLEEMEEEIGFNVGEWVEEIDVNINSSLYTEEDAESLENVHYYRVN